MNQEVAHALIDAELRRLRQWPYSELVKLIGTPETKQAVGADGKPYQLEIEAVWDINRAEDVRVIVSADDGGWRVFKPLTDDFIMRPDGSFVGEFPGD
jgi:hypothetical protein